MRSNTAVWILGAIAVGLSLYSVALIGFELSTSQEAVRPFFSDIVNEERFFGVNTTLSVFLLWATALCFAIALSFSTATTSKKDTLFYISQIAVFGYLGFDDRFKVHEWVAWKLDTEDHYLLLLIGVMNVLCLWFLGRRFLFRPIVSIPLLVAGGFFAVMTLFDAFLPHDMLLRLSIEDLAKTWSSLAFLIFGWAVLKVHCAGDLGRGSPRF